MKNRTKGLLAGAAMAGLMAGVSAQAYPGQTAPTKVGTTLSNAGQLDDSGTVTKHDCKGKNECKGQGGCASDSNGCKGQNSCKGKGGCNTKSK